MIADFFRKKSEGDIRSVEAVSKESQLYYSVDRCNMSTSFVVDEPIYVTDLDEELFQAAYWVITNQKASIGNLQRMFKIGFNRAARIMDQLAEVGVVGPEEGTKARQILVSLSDWEHIQKRIKNKTPEEQKPVIAEEQDSATPVENISFIEIMDKLNGHQFEYFCAAVLLKNGFYDVSVTQGSGDQGVDIVATKSEIRYAIQCKHYSGALGNTPIQEVTAGKIFCKCHVGVVMTNSYFTSGAKELAKATGILLWDRRKLLEMI